MTASDDYANQVHLGTTPERVFGILTDAAEFGAWWAPATGSAAEGGELRISFEGIDEPLVFRVLEATRPESVTWKVTECAFLPDWVGTTPVITLSPSADGGCELRFRHEGLSPALECYEMCRAGWEQYLPSLRDYIAAGTGNPYTPARLG